MKRYAGLFPNPPLAQTCRAFGPHSNHNVPILLTPGPLTTADETKMVMLRDWGSRDDTFVAMTRRLRSELLALVGDRNGEFDCVPMQGSGTFSVEAMLGSLIPVEGRALVLANGAYGRRIASILSRIGRSCKLVEKGDLVPVRGSDVAMLLGDDGSITHVVCVHCETSTGMLNPIDEIAREVKAAGKILLIDAMSSFGAIPLDVSQIQYDALAASSNKCLEGVPGVGFVIARTELLDQAEGNCHSLSLDLHAQRLGLNRNGQWRFTPPTHVVSAFLEALNIHREEGGTDGRGMRYRRNRDILVDGMRSIGLNTLLDDEWLSPIIVSFHYPSHPNFEFRQFYELLRVAGFVIYPGKLSTIDCFRIGCIGRLDETVMQDVITAVKDALEKMGVSGTSQSFRLENAGRFAAVVAGS